MMSKFDELCNAYKTAREKYFSYRDESYSFAQVLFGSYIKYLGIPEKQFKFVPLDKEPKENTSYSIFGAIHLGEDAYWHLGFQITLYEEPNTFPHQPVLIRFMFKKVDDNIFDVKISDADKGQRINVSEEGDFIRFFEFLQSQIRSQFENGLQEFLEQFAPLRIIGFDKD